ncbi:MAG: MarR family transcriptional regulator [Devosia sp.]
MDLSYDRKQSTGYMVNLTARLMVRAIERRLTGGTAGPMPVFLALLNGDAQPQKELARSAAVEQPTMANTLNRMERDGLIERTPDPADGRSMLISLTKLGRQQAAQAMDAATTVNALALAALTPQERTQLLDMLQRLIGVLEQDGS